MADKLNERFRTLGAVDLIEMNGSVLLNSGTSRFTKISGEYVPLVKRMVEMLKTGTTIKEICVALEDDLDEMDVMEILEMLDAYQVIQKSNLDYGLSKDELLRYRQQINHLVARFPGAGSQDYIKQLKNMNVFIYGAELLATRIIESLTLLGIGALNIHTNHDEIVDDEVYNTTFFGKKDVGGSKQDVVVKRCKEINPHVKCQVFVESGDEKIVKDADLVIFALDIPNFASYEELNRYLVKHRRPALLCGFQNDDFFFGPTFVPGETACYACYDKRCLGNKMFYDEYVSFLTYMKQKQRVENALGARLDLISSFVTNEVLMLLPYLEKNISHLMHQKLGLMTMEDAVQLNNVFRYGRPMTWGNQVTFEFYPKFKMEHNPVLRLPRCEVCGATAEKEPMVTPWSLPTE